MAAFVDKVPIIAKAGDGGNGCVSFHREKYVAQGGPDGGDGGRGGSIVFMASERMHTLMDFRYRGRFFAERGADGSANRKKGKQGADLVIEVPPGTLVREKSSGNVLLDMHTPGEPRTLQRGGNGGFGNMHFATPTRQAPNFAKPGIKPRALDLILELKSIADVGLVGFPNVGKSTLLSVMTTARPKIANYHFTTLSPNLGVIRVDEDTFIIADIPGLVEGASQGVGLGHDFLRHVERTRLLLHVLDISGSEGRDPLEDYRAITAELTQYADLRHRPVMVVANKLDIGGYEAHLARLEAELRGKGIELYPISAATGQGLEPLLRAVVRMLRSLPPIMPFEEAGLRELEPEAPYEVSRDEGAYCVAGPAVDHLINSVNFSDEQSLAFFHRSLRRLGIIDALREAGAREGDTVIVEEMEFDFVE